MAKNVIIKFVINDGWYEIPVFFLEDVVAV